MFEFFKKSQPHVPQRAPARAAHAAPRRRSVPDVVDVAEKPSAGVVVVPPQRQVLSEHSQLPELFTILTHGAKPLVGLSIADGLKNSLCAVDIGKREACILVTVEHHGQLVPSIESLRGRLVQNSWSIRETYFCTQELLTQVIQELSSKAASGIDTSKSAGIANFMSWLREAIKYNATDLHLTCKGNRGEMQMRVNTELLEPLVVSRDSIKFAISDAYGLLRSTGQSTDFHEARGAYAMIDSSQINEPYRLRFQYSATVSGGTAAIRLLPEQSRMTVKNHVDAGWAEIGHVDELKRVCRAQTGGFIVAGVTGSGKSLALGLIFQSVINPKDLIIREFGDPIEIPNADIRQFSASRDVADPNDKRDFNIFASEAMRGDPDIIVNGETRDQPTASLFEKAALSGHFAMTTLHANRISGIAPRLSDDSIGLARNRLGSESLLSCLAYLALVPVLCKHCKIPATKILGESASTEDIGLMHHLTNLARSECGIESERLFYRNPRGCEHCSRRGTSGVTNVLELYSPTNKWRDMTARGDDAGAYALFRSESDGILVSNNLRGKTVLQHGLLKAAAGNVDLRSLERFGDLRRYQADHPETTRAS